MTQPPRNEMPIMTVGEAEDEERADAVDHHRDHGDDDDERHRHHQRDVGVGPLLQRLEVALVLARVLSRAGPRSRARGRSLRIHRRRARRRTAAAGSRASRCRWRRRRAGRPRVVVVQPLRDEVHAVEVAGGAVAELRRLLEQLLAPDVRRRERRHVRELRDEVVLGRRGAKQRAGRCQFAASSTPSLRASFFGPPNGITFVIIVMADIRAAPRTWSGP